MKCLWVICVDHHFCNMNAYLLERGQIKCCQGCWPKIQAVSYSGAGTLLLEEVSEALWISWRYCWPFWQHGLLAWEELWSDRCDPGSFLNLMQTYTVTIYLSKTSTILCNYVNHKLFWARQVWHLQCLESTEHAVWAPYCNPNYKC